MQFSTVENFSVLPNVSAITVKIICLSLYLAVQDILQTVSNFYKSSKTSRPSQLSRPILYLCFSVYNIYKKNFIKFTPSIIVPPSCTHSLLQLRCHSITCTVQNIIYILISNFAERLLQIYFLVSIKKHVYRRYIVHRLEILSDKGNLFPCNKSTSHYWR